MEKLKVCFVGLGSIAMRHIRNLKAICAKKNISLTIDAYRHSVNDTVINDIQHTYYHIEDVPSDYDVVFITNPTKCHLELLLLFHNKGKHFFIEKPVVAVEQIETAKQLILRKDSLYYVACPLRYNAVIQYIKENLDLENVISVRSISSSYLPEWRPFQDYRNTYSAHKEMGGGVSIDLIHEWDYLTYLFGWPNKVLCMIGKKSNLEIDSDDYAIYMAEYSGLITELHLDYFGRITRRQIELIMREDTVVGDIVNNTITFLKEGRKIDFHEERDDYQKREIEHFLDMIFGASPKENGFIHGIQVLQLTQGCYR